MPWRVIALGDQVWHVDALAERPANADAWQLVLSFRAAAGGPGPGPGRGPGRGPGGGAGKRAFWAPYPLEASSKCSLIHQAGRNPYPALAQNPSQRLAWGPLDAQISGVSASRPAHRG